SSARDAALTAVGAARLTAADERAHSYTIGEAAADGLWRNDQASVHRDHTLSVTAVEIAYITQIAHAERILESGDAAAAAIRAAAVSQANADFEIAHSQGLAVAISKSAFAWLTLI